MNFISDFFRKNKIKKPPYDYNFIVNLDESEYPLYLANLFEIRTGEKLPLDWSFKSGEWKINKKKCKTFNQKIQWIKLYGVTDLMRKCTDKVLVRDYVKEKIGEEYLKPVLQIIGYSELKNLNKKDTSASNGCLPQYDETITDFNTLSPSEPNNLYNSRYDDVTTYFDQIDFDKLPNFFVIKCNHGCKWQFIIKNKEEYLKNKRLIEITKRQITGWLEQDYSFWCGFEMQYLTSRRVESPDSTLRVRTRLCEGITCGSDNEASDLSDTKRIIEPIGEINEPVYNNKYGLRKGCQDGIKPKILIEPFIPEKRLIEVYCFGSIPKIFADVHLTKEVHICTYNEDFSYSDLILKPGDKLLMQKIFPDEPLKKAVELSGELSKDFKFVRVDWMIYENRLYFEELTFTPYSGFTGFNKNWNFKIGNLINLQ